MIKWKHITTVADAVCPVKTIQSDNKTMDVLNAKVVEQTWYTTESIIPVLDSANRIVEEFYQGAEHWSRIFEYPWALNIISKLPPGKLLESGGSHSCFQLLAARAGHKVFNVDTDELGLRTAKARYKNYPELSQIELVTGDLTNLQYPDNFFDIVVSISTLEHISDYKKALTELWRTLKPGGKCILTIDIVNNKSYNFNIDYIALYEIRDLLGIPLIKSLPHNGVVHRNFIDVCTKTGNTQKIDITVWCACLEKPASEEPVIDQSNKKLDNSRDADVSKMLQVNVERKNNLQKEAKDRPIIDTSKPQELFDKHYFDGGGKVGGYTREGYRDFPVHEITFNHVLARKPESVIELGSARGYILKRLHDVGISGVGYDVSKHCVLTRATHNVIQKNLFDRTWEHHADLVYSLATLEHIPEEHIPNLIKLMAVHCKRGLHGIDFGEKDDGFDKTRVTLKSKGWWLSQFDKYAPGWPVEIVDKEELEKGEFPKEVLQGDGKVKLNLGSFSVMFHHGWINMDIHDLAQFAQVNGYKFQRHDLRNGVPYGTSEVDLIYSSHTLEHFSYEDGLKLLRECRRVLKPDGCIRIIVPDASILLEHFKDNSLSKFDEMSHTCEKSKTQLKKLHSILYDNHLAVYDFATLEEQLREANFVPELRSFRQGHKQILKETIDMFPDISLFVEGTIEA